MADRRHPAFATINTNRKRYLPFMENLGQGLGAFILIAIGILSLPLIIAYLASVTSKESGGNFINAILKLCVAIAAVIIVGSSC